jgi:hypothetical protein
MMKEKNLDELFREKLLNYEQEPPTYLLENILDGMAQNRRKKRLMWIRISGVAAALLLAFVAGWQFNISENQIAEAKINNKIKSIDNQKSENNSSEIKINEKIEQNNTVNLVAGISGKVQNEAGVKIQAKSIAIDDNFVPGFPESASAKHPGGNFLVLKPIIRVLTKAEGSESLHEKKQPQIGPNAVEKSIDQQIMEMNQQMLAASSRNNTKARWLVGAQVSPEYNGAYSSHSQSYASNMLKTQSSKVDLSGGISVEYKKGKRWSVQSGIYYSGMGQTSGSKGSKEYNYAVNDGVSYFGNTAIKVDAIANKYTMNSNAGVVELTQIPAGMTIGASLDDKSYLTNAVVSSQNTFIQDFDYLEIPLYLRYNLVDSRFGISMIGGLSSNILVGNRLYAESNSGRSLVGHTKDLETFNYSGTIGLGFKYGLTDKISLSVEPRLKYFINSLSSNASVVYKPYKLGIFTGLTYEF